MKRCSRWWRKVLAPPRPGAAPGGRDLYPKEREALPGWYSWVGELQLDEGEGADEERVGELAAPAEKSPQCGLGREGEAGQPGQNEETSGQLTTVMVEASGLHWISTKII